MPISKMISWISCSDFPSSQIAKEFAGWIKGEPKDIGTATFETPMRPGRGSHVTDGKPHIVIRSL